MFPVIALVGRPNVGKSTLFNRLTKSRDALVANFPGLTRDRIYGSGKIGDRGCIVIDTGGLSHNEHGIEELMAQQARLAIDEADAVIFLVDGREGMTVADQAIAQRLRETNKTIFLVVNKAEGFNPDVISAEFHSLGLGVPYVISAAHGEGVHHLMEGVLSSIPVEEEGDESIASEQIIKVALVGRPNVGKSTLTNRMLGEDRVLVFDMPGTTRDSIYIPFTRENQQYILIDTAGVRRRTNITETTEKFSVIKTLQAIEEANVVIMVLDARQGIGKQDASLLGYVLERGRALVVAVNKWDGLDTNQRQQIKSDLERKLSFVNFSKIHYISALHGTGVGNLFDVIVRTYKSATRSFSTSELMDILTHAVASHQPPIVRGRRIKLRYAHQGGKNPPVVVIHGNQTEDVPESYQRYLENIFTRLLKLEGTPLRIEFRTGHNPYKDKRNKLTPRQIEKRRRLMRHVRKA